MEIPYIVTPRKDTGLFNSKIAIWLFLASEVMLFGGFFSAYVFLRMGADYPWPERALPVAPGLINTFVLIASSVTVVFAWAGLKLRNWRQFQLCMGFTVICAVIFMCLKGIEYNVKFHHQAVRLKDFSVIEGHIGYELKDGVDAHKKSFDENDFKRDFKGRKIEENVIRYHAEGVTFDTMRFHKPWVTDLLDQAKHQNAKIVLAKALEIKTAKGVETINAGEALSLDLLAKIQGLHKANRTENGATRTAANRAAWDIAKQFNGFNDYASKSVNNFRLGDMIKLKVDEKKGENGTDLLSATFNGVDVPLKKTSLFTEVPNVAFKIEPAAEFEFAPADINESKGTLRDNTALAGKLLDSPMVFHYVDAFDFRHVAMKAKEKGIDPLVAVDNCWLVQHSKDAKDAWEWNKGQMKKLEAELIQKHGYKKDKDGKPTTEPYRVPTFSERYRIGWQDFVAKQQGKDRDHEEGTLGKEQFTGPDYEGRHDAHTFPMGVHVPREQVMLDSKFAPKWNTYYAIYFTMTGLHGLHVIGGALVLAYYLFFGKKMFDTNPEWLANRVEVGGLFWHFVDLVWIFLFPILYLM